MWDENLPLSETLLWEKSTPTLPHPCTRTAPADTPRVSFAEMLNKNPLLHLIKIDSALLLMPDTATSVCSAHGHIILLPEQKVGGGDSTQDRSIGLSLGGKCSYACYPPPASFVSMLSPHILQLYPWLSDIGYLKEKKLQDFVF